ncbi:cytochrome-c peroxidase [Thalassotalea sp. PS06]|uniref:cytochrome-c peroxidase n=1 Tax=Thalassotalea sp. PS06 TaxID=2594005 RepID=UPI00116344F6|nr:cytochrome c peroxidase [Thalassotalea sp. PS06]QDP01237.1 cytochrome-c peroxidase [Thalassotalea sp. PS06]
MIKVIGSAIVIVITISIAVVWGTKPVKPKTTLVDFTAPFVFGHFKIPQDNPFTYESVKLGRRLFYDPILSGNNQISCATCHKQELAFTDGLSRAVGASGNPLPFNSMSLVNLMWGPRHFFWNGRVTSLESQALMPIQHVDEMDQDLDELIEELEHDETYQELFANAYGDISAENIAKALASFQRSLISANSKYDKYLRGEINLTDEEELGRKLFMAHPDTKVSLRGGNCIDCHSQFLTAGFATGYDGFSNNGLDKDSDLKDGLYEVTGNEAHRGLFKVPTLRNIAVTGPYMHDGRFNTLEEVLEHYNSGIKLSNTLSPLIIEADNREKTDQQSVSLHLTEKEKRAIIAFLHTLTDQEFLSNDAFSDPFRQESEK